MLKNTQEIVYAEGVEEVKHSIIADRSENLYNYFRNQFFSENWE